MTLPFACDDVASPSEAELKELIQFAHKLADASGAAILPFFRTANGMEDKVGKAGYDPVTEGDRAGERAIRALIEEFRPDDGIFGEEEGYKPGENAYTWVLDPIDGTRSFVMGRPIWGTLIGLYISLIPPLIYRTVRRA